MSWRPSCRSLSARPAGQLQGTIAGSALYLIGVIFVTMRLNVPMNNALARVSPDATEAVPVWNDYVARWDSLEPRPGARRARGYIVIRIGSLIALAHLRTRRLCTRDSRTCALAHLRTCARAHLASYRGAQELQRGRGISPSRES